MISNSLTRKPHNHRITYEDELGRPRTWEAMQRPTRPRTSTVDAVQMIAVQQQQTPNSQQLLLLEKQFRAPAGKVVVEFPAGLVDEGESPEEAALRELREETGYVGEVVPDHGGGGGRPRLWSGAFYELSAILPTYLPGA